MWGEVGVRDDAGAFWGRGLFEADGEGALLGLRGWAGRLVVGDAVVGCFVGAVPNLFELASLLTSGCVAVVLTMLTCLSGSLTRSQLDSGVVIHLLISFTRSGPCLLWSQDS